MTALVRRLRSPRRSRHHGRGLALVEMVLVMPILAVMMLATAELGRAFYHYTIVQGAVRAAARFLAANAIYGNTGVVDLSKVPEVVAGTRNLVVYGNSAGTGAALLPNLRAAQVTVENLGGGDVGVTCTYPYQPLLADLIPVFPPIVMGGGGPLQVDLRASVSLRAL
jgi:hypothetical protein